MIGYRDEFCASRLCGEGHLFDRVLTVGPGRVTVDESANVAGLDEVDLPTTCQFDFVGAFPNLGRNPLETKSCVDLTFFTRGQAPPVGGLERMGAKRETPLRRAPREHRDMRRVPCLVDERRAEVGGPASDDVDTRAIGQAKSIRRFGSALDR